MRSRSRKMFAALCTFACCGALEAQIASPSEPRAGNAAGSLVVFETANHTLYLRDVPDYSLLATRPGPIAAEVPRTFSQVVIIGDLVSVNGRRVTGTVVELGTDLQMRPGAAAGQAIGDVTRGSWIEWYIEILHEDGQPIGSIRVSGMTGGQPPPGQISQIQQASYVVLGGNGAFLGVRGYMGASGPNTAPIRRSSVTEDPANRRLHGGGRVRQGLYLIPMSWPEVIITSNGPAIFHADFSPVTATNPAKPGEVVISRVSGLGPVRAAIEPGEPFPSDPLAVVNSPIDVTVNGGAAQVINAVGWPGTTDNYRLDFQIPAGTLAGDARVRIAAAWMAGPEVRIAVR